MNILSIGNSFSEDAQRYIHAIARSKGDVINTYNLYIGGCSLAIHYRNMTADKRRYTIGVNGHSSYFYTSIREALLSCDWDVVTLQQASHFSFDYETYQPYIGIIASEIRKLCPKAKIAIHQTWAYEEESYRLTKELGYKKRADMYAKIKESYKKAAEDIKADFIIPSGELMEKLTENGIEKVHRDTFHASFGVGRFAIGALWYSCFTGKSVDDLAFSDFDEEIRASEIDIVKKTINQVKQIYGI